MTMALEQKADHRPVTARTMLVPVVSALLRNTEGARTTHSPCSTGNAKVTVTAAAKPSPVRKLLRTATASVLDIPGGHGGDSGGTGDIRSANPVSGSRHSERRAQTGRASAAAAAMTIRPVTPTAAQPMVRRVNRVRPSATAAASFGSAGMSTMSER